MPTRPFARLWTILICICALLFVNATGAQAADNRSALTALPDSKWLNVSRPVTANDMKDKFLLLDFWTYGCINCMQIAPDLEKLEETFGDKLLVLGIHSAKFKGEQDSARILSAAKRFGLNHPVVNDSDFAIWKSFGVEAWPTLVLLGPDGSEISRYSGEGHREDLKNDIEKNIASIPAATESKKVASLAPVPENDMPLAFPSRILPAHSEPYGDVLWIADTGHNRLIAIDKLGKIKVTVGSGERGLNDGTLATAQFNKPHGMEIIGDTLYVADTGNHALRCVDLKDGSVTTIAGDGARGFKRIATDGQKATDVQLASPWDIRFYPDARKTELIVAMAGFHQLYAYDIASGIIRPYAGTGGENIDDGAALNATLAQPSGLSITSDGTVYFVDAESSSLRQVKNGEITTLIGTGLFDFGLKDGTYPSAQMQHPQGLSAVAGRIYIADTYNNAVRIYDTATKQLSTLPLGDVKLNEPTDVKIIDDMAYIVDTGNHRVLKTDLKTMKTSELGIAE